MSETDWIKRYFTPLATSIEAAGLADDAALMLETARARVVTVDALVEGVHFLPGDPIETVARKLVRVNVSDVLAKGAEPGEALLTLGWPEGRGEDELARFAEAFGDELEVWGIRLLGGDTVTHPGGLFLSLTLTGFCLGDWPIRRSGAAAGDDIWVTGEIGLGGLGLAAARGEISDPDWLVAAHYREPKLPIPAMAELISNHAAASMDVSDGLLIDLNRLLQASGAGASITLEDIPFPAQIDTISGKLSAITAGDDYQILFTTRPDRRESVIEVAAKMGQPLALIGKVSAEKTLQLQAEGKGINLPETLGFEHGTVK